MPVDEEAAGAMEGSDFITPLMTSALKPHHPDGRGQLVRFQLYDVLEQWLGI